MQRFTRILLVPHGRFLLQHRPHQPLRFSFTTVTAAVTDTQQQQQQQLLTDYREKLRARHKDAWHHYQKLVETQPQQLERNDFVQLRSILWKMTSNQWGAEDRILQTLEDMKLLGHAWTILEYNEYFMVKLHQARYDDILRTYKEVFADQKQQPRQLGLSIGTFNVVLATFLEKGMTQDAILLVRDAYKKWNLIPDIRDFDRTMFRCMPGNRAIVDLAREYIAEYAFDHPKILETNIHHLHRKKNLEGLRWIYNRQKTKKLALSTYALLVRGFLDCRAFRDAEIVYEDMRAAGLKPNPLICANMLAVCAFRRDAQTAETIVKETLEGGHELDEHVYSQLIRVYFRVRAAGKALKIFEHIQRDPNLRVNEIIINSMIDGLVINKEMDAAMALYRQMTAASDSKPDLVTFNTLLKGFVAQQDFASALNIINDMYKHHCEPDTVTFTTLLDGIFLATHPKNADEMLAFLHQTGMRPNIYTFNAVISKWIQNKQMAEAERTLVLMQRAPYNMKPTVHTYTNLIQGYAEAMDLQNAMLTFQKMVRRGVAPDRATYHFMIRAFLDHDRLEDAMTCFVHMKRDNIKPTTDSFRIMMNECVRRENWEIGAQIIRELEDVNFEIKSGTLRSCYDKIKFHTISANK